MSKISVSLKQVPLFKDLSEEKLEEISSFFTVVKREKKCVLYMEGENPDCLHFLTCGSVKGYACISESRGRNVMSVIYQPGDFFAESSLDAQPLPFTLITREYSIMLKVSTKNFWTILESNPTLYRKFLTQQAMEKLEMNKRLNILTQLDAAERVKQFLCLIFKKSPMAPINLTHEEIGDGCGMTRETTSRILGLFRKTGQIVMHGRRIIPCFE